jgi:hypothetical protein
MSRVSRSGEWLAILRSQEFGMSFEVATSLNDAMIADFLAIEAERQLARMTPGLEPPRVCFTSSHRCLANWIFLV